MTDRYNYLTVALERDIRDDDAEPLIQAIQMLKGVAGVKPNVADGDSYAATRRINAEWMESLYNLMQSKEGEK